MEPRPPCTTHRWHYDGDRQFTRVWSRSYVDIWVDDQGVRVPIQWYCETVNVGTTDVEEIWRWRRIALPALGNGAPATSNTAPRG